MRARFEAFKASHPAWPMMWCDEEFEVEWENLTTVAEHTDAPKDWDAVDDAELVMDVISADKESE